MNGYRDKGKQDEKKTVNAKHSSNLAIHEDRPTLYWEWESTNTLRKGETGISTEIWNTKIARYKRIFTTTSDFLFQPTSSTLAFSIAWCQC